MLLHRTILAWMMRLLLLASLSASLSAQQAARKIQPNDLLVIRVVGENDMSKETKVTGDGKINYVFIGDVQVGGQTIAEAQDQIREMLMKGWLVNPQVIIEMKQYAEETVTVMGEVNRPGRIVLPTDRRVDLVEVIGLAGDFTRNAKKSHIELRRKGTRVAYSYDELKKISDPAKKVFVQPDDFIEVGISIF